ncbi:type III secretion system chaperone family protein [Aureimonas frigidaquae]|uniref:YbjN domain-containing protein n=1 Tax=Aureimonas frigidaquae TaxID=424757 RepID=UPI0007815367|nr:YbjN domain-containing protein [Aureimonas frigidaquae]
MRFGELEFVRQSHPVDVIELVAADRDWSFERLCDDEISMSVAGQWADYSVSFSWVEDCEALHLGCAFELKVPERRLAEVHRLLCAVNEKMLVGHFDLWASENAIMFRHAQLLCGGAEPTGAQVERMLVIALECCDRYFQAFQFVVWANKPAEEALSDTLFETVGNA